MQPYRTFLPHDKRGGFFAITGDKAPPKIHHAEDSRRSPPTRRAASGPSRAPFRAAQEARASRADPSERPGTQNLSAGADPGLGASRRKGRGGRSAILRRRARLARFLPALRPAVSRGAALPLGLAERRGLRQDPARQHGRSRAARPALRCLRTARARGEPFVAMARSRRPAAQPRPRPDPRRRGRARPCPGHRDHACGKPAGPQPGRDPVSAAAKAAAAFSAFPDAPAAEAEILALWAFALAIRLRRLRPLRLIAATILDPAPRQSAAKARRARLAEARRGRPRRRLRP